MILKIKIFFYYLKFLFFLNFRKRERLVLWQERQVRKHLRSIRTRSKYFNKLLSYTGLENWRNLPEMNKVVMMENFDSINTVGLKRDAALDLAIRAEKTRDFSPMVGNITVGLSSGTSGNRGLFIVSPQERAQHAGAIVAKLLPGSIFKGWKIAFFLRANSNLYSSSQSRWIQFEYFDLLNPIDHHVDRLNAFQPDILIAQPSMLIQLAEQKNSGLLKIHPLKTVSVAEVLDPLDQKKIETSFSQIVHQVYQCTEGFLGITCTEGTIHLNEDIVHIEPKWIDQEKTKFQPIITDFSRSSQPVIRYLLNDILTVYPGKCPCGQSLLQSVQLRGVWMMFYSFMGARNKI